ncbi:MAG TPA: BadF/BadG/BcrA/BcrD ATPase family protein [Gemmatimonadaceae bacterium]|jgi:glucosamine kinase|nr:BadF/BadG/BcrA/BcrD ATPase family protein [Gemmatimonadaceae bacterium]
MISIVIGVDGGGSRTRVVVADDHGVQLGSAEGPGSAVRPGEAERSAEIIATLCRDALASCRMTHVLPKVVCVGVAGVGRDTEREALWQSLAGREIAEEIVVHADAAVALDDAFGDGPGILLIAGTGSVAFGRGPTGTPGRCGGWGPVCGDEGGGSWIGRRALSVVTAAVDGREPETALVGAVLTAAEVEDARELIPWAANASSATLATLAPVVAAVAESGDLRANAILSLAAEELSLHVRTLARHLFGDERASCPVALGGGLLAPGMSLRKRVEHRLKSSVPGAQIRAEEVVPVRGAIRGALRFLGVEAK